MGIMDASLTGAVQACPGGHRVATGLPGDSVTTESLTYSELGDRLGASPEAARSLTRRLRLPASRAMMERCASLLTSPKTNTRHWPPAHRAPRRRTSTPECADRADVTELATLEVEKNCLEASIAGARGDFERERDRCDTLIAETWH